LKRRSAMAREKMSLGQLVDILCVLWKMLFGGEIAYDDVSCTTAQEILKGDHKAFVSRFVKFLANGGRFIFGGLKIAPAPFDPQKFIGGSWSFWKGPKDGDGKNGEEERDKASLSLSEVDFEKVDFTTCLEEGESSIGGEEKLVRLRKLNCVVYGTTVFAGLWQDYQQNKANSVLEKLYQQRGVAFISFFGDVLRSPDGDRYVLCLCRSDDGSWDWCYGWLGRDWSGRGFTVVSQQVSSEVLSA